MEFKQSVKSGYGPSGGKGKAGRFILLQKVANAFERIGKLFPTTWGYKLLAENVFKFESLLPLLLIFILATAICSILLRRIDN